MDTKKPFKSAVTIDDGVIITITSNHSLSNAQIRKYLSNAVYHESLKDPEITEIYGFRTDIPGVIDHYDCVAKGSYYHLYNKGRDTGIMVTKSTLRDYLSNSEAKPLILEREFGRSVSVIFGFTEEEVRKKVIKYYLP